MAKYPCEFIGRCHTCLDNAYLNNKPCQTGYGNGMPVSDDDCMVRRAQRKFDYKRTTSQPTSGKEVS